MDFENNNRFKEGQQVSVLYFPSEEEGTISIEHDNCDYITVVMENGQMAGVPWFAVWHKGKVVSKWNGALLAGVQL